MGVLGRGARAALALGAMGLMAAPALTAEFINVQASGLFEEDDGTYRMEPVTSVEECTALCKADPLCRGSVTFQPDVTKVDAVCRLNNGQGANPAFPATPPAPWTLETAVSELNAYRAEYGLQPVRLNMKLVDASDVHARDLAAHGIAAHEGTDGSTHGERVQRQGYYFTVAAENVATGQKSWPEVFQAWKDSDGHNRNLLLPDATEFGIALAYEPTTLYSTYWAMVMASPQPDLMASRAPGETATAR